VRALDLDAPLRASRPLSIPEYEALRRGDAGADTRPAPSTTALDAEAPPVAFLGVDEGARRVYASA
jgi:hypothetical protein